MNTLEKKEVRIIDLDEECPNCKKNLSIKPGDIFRVIYCKHCKQYGRVSEKSTGECCENPALRNVRFKTAGDTIQIRKQCFVCGHMPGKALGGFLPEEKIKLPFADIEKKGNRDYIYTELWNKVTAWIKENREKAQQERSTAWWEAYTAYLESPVWKAKAKKILIRDNHLCQSCLLAPASQVHHKSYQFVDFLGGEPAFDLESICTPCHDRIHKKKEEQS